MSTKKVTVLAKFKAKKGNEDSLKQAIMACVPPTRAEEGCINYDLHQLSDDKAIFILYENWKSQEDLEAHLDMPYLRDLKAKADELCSEPIEISLWQMLSEPN